MDETPWERIPTYDLTKTSWPVDPTSFGGWSLDDEDLVLDHAEECYHVNLERCLTSAGVLDAICQVSMKTWATDAIAAGLVRMLNRTLGPQQTLCGRGVSYRIAKKNLRRIVDANIARYPGLPIRRDLRHG